MNKTAYLVALSVGLSSIFLTAISLPMMNQKTIERLLTDQNGQINAFETSSNARRRFGKEEFWTDRGLYESDEFYPMNVSTGQSVFASKLTGLTIFQSPVGLTREPTSRIRVDHRDRYVFSVGRLVAFCGVAICDPDKDLSEQGVTESYEIFAETDVREVYFTHLWVPIAHILSLFFSFLGAFWIVKYTENKTRTSHMSEILKTQRILNAAIDELADGLAIVDEKGIIVLTNSTFDKMMGYKHQELWGESFNVFVAPDRADWHDAQMAQSLKENEDVSYRDVKPYRKDGTQIQVNLGIKWMKGHYRGLRLAIATVREVQN